MRTTLNLPDAIVAQAKQKALAEGTSLTELLVRGLRELLGRYQPERELPVSKAKGGLVRDVEWDSLEAAESAAEAYR